MNKISHDNSTALLLKINFCQNTRYGRDLFKKFQGVPLAKKEGSAFGVVLRATEKAFVENLTKLEQMSRLGKLNASKNK